MLSNGSSKKPIKQGWILKKAGSGLLAPWRPKYLSLCNSSRGLVLKLFDSLDQQRPKHEILVDGMQVEQKNHKFGMLSRNAVAFTIYAKSRKFYFAASTKLEFDDWAAAWNNDGKDLVSRSVSRQSYQSRRIDSDARSVYSCADNDEDDTMSVISTFSRQTITEAKESQSVSSAIDTLSFSSEPVLTPQELNMMSQEDKTSAEDLKNPFMKRRATMEAINESTSIIWHEKYCEILQTRAITEEQSLQKDVQLMELVGMFQERASLIAKSIIDEYHINGAINSEFKMNKDNIFQKESMVFRFACDYDTFSPSQIQQAMTKTSAELRANNAIIKAVASNPHDSKQFYTILMALVDYKGFRMIVNADLSKSTQMQPIHDLNPRRLKINEDYSNSTQVIANSLNLAAHTVQVNDDRRVKIPLAATVEIHQDVKNDRTYLTCLRDIFPVDYYTPEVSGSRTFGQNELVPNSLNKLRSEFVAKYQNPLSSDALTPASGGSRREKEMNDEEVMKASRFLRENWIPAFVRSLDGMEIRPFDSASLTTEMHLRGINMRYLGFVCKTCNIPFIRSLALVEMVARVCKVIYQNKIRGAILHFRSVGATAIEDQMNQYTSNLFSTILGFTERTAQLIETKIRPEVKRKFDFNLTNKDYLDISRPALFLALQFHCGITFENHTEYDFMDEAPVPKSRVISFEPRVKTLTGTHDTISLSNATDDHKLAYIVARHFKSLGPKSKLLHLNSSATILTYVSAHYNSTNRFEEARLYAQAAVASAQKNHAIFGLSTAQLMYAVAGIQTTGLSGPEPSLLGWYGKAIGILAWHWGAQNPLSMSLYDEMSAIYHKSKDPQKAFEFHQMSLKVADTTLGNNHIVTAGYLTRAGCYLSNLGKVDEAVKCFTQALNIYTSARGDPSLIAEVHYHYADALFQKGDYDKALEHSQKCRRMRETCFGFTDLRVIQSNRQLAKLLLTPYKDYKGVLTVVVKSAYKDAIACHEKVFRYLQNQQSGVSRRKSFRRSASGLAHSTRSHSNAGAQLSIAGPLVKSPFGWAPPFAKNLMHKLTKEIVFMKLALVESPVEKECIRTARQKRMQGTLFEDGFDAEDARSTIMKMAAVTPSVYLDDILSRIGQGDDSAIQELGMVLELTESETVGLKE